MNTSKKYSGLALLMLVFNFSVLIFSSLVFVNNKKATLNLTDYILLGALFLVFSLVILRAVKWVDDAPLYRIVRYPVKPEELVLNKIYYLNGKTPAVYLRQDNTGKYVFMLDGSIKLTAGNIKEYVSAVDESTPSAETSV